MNYIIINSNIILKDKILLKHDLIVKNNHISNIVKKQSSTLKLHKNYEIIDAEGGYVTPGLIEMHIHGCGPFDFAAVSPGDYNKATAFLQGKGINIFLPTFQYNFNYLKNLHAALEKEPDLKKSIPGYYIEGPFINSEKKGGILDKNISSAGLVLLEKIIEQSKGLLRIMTIAPEIKDAENMIHHLLLNNIIPALGHSKCTISDLKALEKYSSKLNVTHLYNAMSGISHKLPGLAMYPFLNKEIFFELNGDGIHLSEEIIKMSYEHLNHEKLILISDAVVTAGSNFGQGEYCGNPVVSDKNGVRYKKNGTLIGSNKILPDIIVNFIKVTGAPIYEAVKFATLNPARLLGLDNKLGSIKIGKTADLVIFDKDFKVKRNLKSE
jgi:N-acetylglucosamine-6-phosphate deacetylase